MARRVSDISSITWWSLRFLAQSSRGSFGPCGFRAFFAHKSQASYTIRCGQAGQIEGLSSAVFDTRVLGRSGDKIGVFSATDSHSSNRNSDQYDRAFVQRAVDLAIQHGIDPYYQLSTLIVERPPHDYAAASKVMPWRMYYDDYGIPPIDAIAAAEALGCTLTSQPGQRQADGVIHRNYTPQGAKRVLEIDQRVEPVSGRTEVRTLALLPFRTGQPPRFELIDTAPENGVEGPCARLCCVRYRFSAGAGSSIFPTFIEAAEPGQAGAESDPDLGRYVRRSSRLKPEAESHARITQVLAHRFKEDTWSRAGRLDFVRSQRDPFRRLALRAQAYNGYGVAGASERSNSCMNGINGRFSPVYGSGVMDLTLNMFMSNSEIREMVEASARRQGREVSSVICRELGAGAHRIDPAVFSRQQRQFLAGRPGCTPRTYQITSPPTGPRTESVGNRTIMPAGRQ
jgi:hypothetical protein